MNCQSLIFSGLMIDMINGSSVKLEINGTYETGIGRIQSIGVDQVTIETDVNVAAYPLSDITDVITFGRSKLK